MRVLAIDPGYDRVGIAVMEYRGSETVVYSTCIETDRTKPMSHRLHTIGEQVLEIISEYQPDTCAIEKLFFNKNTKTAIAVAEARGMLLYIAQQAGCQVYEFSPQEIKVATTGHGGSSKHDVQTMVTRLVTNVPSNALDDEYDAIAVGVTCLAHYGRTS